jgi:hypothetical protein
MTIQLSGNTGSVPARSAVDPLVPTLFHEPWWLDAATGGCYEQVTVRSGGREVGRLPFLLNKQFGLTECVLPQLTPFLGPAVDEGNGRAVQRRDTRRRVIHRLLEQLPPHSRFHQRLCAGSDDALPFVEQDFAGDVDFTYEVRPNSPEIMWSNMRDKTRNVIRRAQEHSELVDLDPVAFSRLYEGNLKRRGLLFNYMWRTPALPVFEAATERRRARILGARDSNGNLAAATFVAWDQATTYLILTTRRPDAHSGIVSRLIWEAMKESAERGTTFDFGGVGTRGSILFYSGFGGEVAPRYVVQRASRAFRAVDFSIRKVRSIQTKLLGPLIRWSADEARDVEELWGRGALAGNALPQSALWTPQAGLGRYAPNRENEAL